MLTINRLSHSDALKLLEGARKKALDIGVPMCIAVTDESGNLIAFERMDGGKITSVTVAQEKAFTAAAARKATHEYNEVCVPGNLVFGIHTSLCVVGGGFPVVVDGEVVGGIGVSSGTPQQDMECAQAGIDSLLASLPLI
ncbi:MAG: heme-binding protein [Chromatiales bacterium]|nr:heme-binding protein [Chromatiales bacterium]